MGSTPTPSDINSQNREFWAKQDHIGRYGDAIAAANDALTKYDTYGHGRFAWVAYRSVRNAEKLWPAYREAMIAYVSTWGNGQEARLTTEVLDSLRERVLSILDDVVGELLELADTSSKEGHAAIKRALRIDGDRSPRSSGARELEEEIIQAMANVYRTAASLQVRFASGESSRGGPPPATAQHIQRIVANSTGVSISQVDAVWRQYLADGELAGEYKTLILQVKERDKQLRRRAVPKVKTAPKKQIRKPSSGHVWRQPVRSKI
jgi:hypothetical protein